MKVLVSACLLGEQCRYDGQTKQVNAIIEALAGCEIIPFCPEAPLFGTPREKINVVERDGERQILTLETKIDVTLRLRDEISSFIEKNPDIDRIILKSKSPSCGYQTTPIYNTNQELIKIGNGIAADMLKNHFKNIEIEDETNFC